MQKPICLFLSLLSVSACNTMAGLGRDVAYAGNSVVKWSTDMRDEIPSTGYVAEDANKLVITDANGNVVGKVDAQQPPENNVTASVNTESHLRSADDVAADATESVNNFHSTREDRIQYQKPRYYQYQGTR
jgi:predicted small secreted protein